MQEQRCRTIFSLFVQVVISLALFIPLTGNAGSTLGSPSAHRGLSSSSSGIHRGGLNRTHALSIPSRREHRNIQQHTIGHRNLNRTRALNSNPGSLRQPVQHTGNWKHKHPGFLGNVAVQQFGKPVKHHGHHHQHHKKFGDHKKFVVHKKHVRHIPVKHHRHLGLFINHQPIRYYSYRSSYYSAPSAYVSPGYSGYSPAEDKYPVESVPVYGIGSPGWSLLSRGQVQAALNIFDREARDHATAGIPKAGYALAAAASGDLVKGVLAMREAFRVDPDTLQYIKLDENLITLVDGLIEKYEYRLKSGNRYPDEAFMVSALNYLKGDFIAAHYALGLALAYGDKSPDLSNLHRLIYVQLQGNYAGEYN
jgi:hypothetical protein